MPLITLMACCTNGEASQWCLQMVWSLDTFQWRDFNSVKWKTSPLWFCVSNKTVDSHYRRERRLSFFPPWESQSATAAVARGSFLQMNNRTLLFFSITVFYRKCPSIPLSCRPRTWRATWTLAFPTQPLPSSLSRTSMTTLPCWPPELWVITNEVMGNSSKK